MNFFYLFLVYKKVEINDLEDEDYYNDFDYEHADLNNLSHEEIQRHKEAMEKKFNSNSLKPGDEGYKYDKQQDFKTDKFSAWDDEDSMY